MYTQNQTRQFFVANSANNITLSLNDGYLTLTYDNKTTKPTHIVIDGGDTHLVEAHITYAADQAYTSKATIVTVDENYLDNNKMINGEDYLVNINIPQYYVMSDLVDTWKYGVVHAFGNMTTSDFYKRMALSLYGNFKNEPWPILKFGVTTTSMTSYDLSNDNNITWISDTTTLDSLSGTYTALIIDEEAQDWHLGKMEQQPVLYHVYCDRIMYSGEEVVWGNTTTQTGKLTINNGKKIADQEYFYHGERGDIYRELAYPNNFDNVGVANPSTAYDVIDIHYYWQGANHAVQKSEKDVTIAVASSTTRPVLEKFTEAGVTLDGVES